MLNVYIFKIYFYVYIKTIQVCTKHSEKLCNIHNIYPFIDLHGFDLIKILYCRFTRFCDVLPLFYKSIQYLETFVSHLLLLPFYACIHLFKHVLFVCTDYIKTVFIINQQCLFLYIPIHV